MVYLSLLLWETMWGISKGMGTASGLQVKAKLLTQVKGSFPWSHTLGMPNLSLHSMRVRENKSVPIPLKRTMIQTFTCLCRTLSHTHRRGQRKISWICLSFSPTVNNLIHHIQEDIKYKGPSHSCTLLFPQTLQAPPDDKSIITHPKQLGIKMLQAM